MAVLIPGASPELLTRYNERAEHLTDVEAVERLLDAAETLDRLAAFLWANPRQFPSGADTCEYLDECLRATGRKPREPEPAKAETARDRCARDLEDAGWPSVAEDVREGLNAETMLRRLREIGEEDSDAADILAEHEPLD